MYALVGRKPNLLRLLVESAISSTDEPVPAEEREYVRAVRAETDARRKLEVYAQAMRQIHVDERRWTPDQYADWLASAWRQLVLKP